MGCTTKIVALPLLSKGILFLIGLSAAVGSWYKWWWWWGLKENWCIPVKEQIRLIGSVLFYQLEILDNLALNKLRFLCKKVSSRNVYNFALSFLVDGGFCCCFLMDFLMLLLVVFITFNILKTFFFSISSANIYVLWFCCMQFLGFRKGRHFFLAGCLSFCWWNSGLMKIKNSVDVVVVVVCM